MDVGDADDAELTDMIMMQENAVSNVYKLLIVLEN